MFGIFNYIKYGLKKKTMATTNEIKDMSQNGIDFLINNEGLRLKPYIDTQGVATIGIGSTFYEDGAKVKMSDPAITKLRAIELFKYTLKMYELGVYSVTRDDINQNEFDALVSFVYNIGVQGFKTSTVLKYINARKDRASIEKAFMMWTKNKELIPRRTREVKLFFTPIP